MLLQEDNNITFLEELSMKQFKVREYGNDVYIQTLQNSENISNGQENYSSHSDYFQQLLETIGKCIEEINLVLNVTDEYTLLTLYLKEEQQQFAEDIKAELLKSFPEDIEQIGISGNEVNIMDYFYEFY